MSETIRVEGRSGVGRVSIFLKSVCACVVFFVFIHISEIILSSLSSNYKILSGKVLLFSQLYLIFGLLSGLILGGVAVALSASGKRYRVLRGFSPDALVVTGLLWFYVFVVLNAYYQSRSPLLSLSSILVNVAIIVLSIPLIIVLSKLGRMGREQSFFGRTSSASFSMAIVLTSLHAFLRPHFEGARLGPTLAGTIAYAYILAALFAVAIEWNLLDRLFLRGNAGGNRRWAGWVLLKILIPVAYLIVLVSARRARPLEAEYEKVSGAPAGGEPNIIILVMDTVRQDRLSAYGCERKTSPNIDKLAREGLVFDGYSTSNWTLPSHASLVTGLYPSENGTQITSSYRLDEANETLAEILVRHGYRTGAVIANCAALSVDSGLPQGFNYYFTDAGELLPPFHFWAGYFVRKFRPNSRVFLAEQFMRASVVNRKAVEWLKRNSRGPFFLLLNYMDAHSLYLPPPPYDRKWSEQESLLHLFHPQIKYVTYRDEVNFGSRRITNEEHDYLLGQYDGGISYMDEQIGKLLKTLKEMHLYDNTLIVITSDHGEFFGEHGLMEHPGSLYQEIIHVPLVVKPPAGADARVKAPAGPVSLVHLFHSILNLAHIPDESGRSEADIFQGETTPVLAECHLTGPIAGRLGSDIYCLIEGDRKLIVSSNGRQEVFNIKEDKGELHNLKEEASGESVQSINTAISRLDERINELKKNAFKPTEIDAEKRGRIREKLKALGYIQ